MFLTVTNSKAGSSSHFCPIIQCWETRVGQEMYKLTLFDLLISIAVLVLVEFPRRYKLLREQYVC